MWWTDGVSDVLAVGGCMKWTQQCTYDLDKRAEKAGKTTSTPDE